VTRKVLALACLAAGGFFTASVFATSLPAAFGLATITLSTPVTTATVTPPAVTTSVKPPAVTTNVTATTPVSTVTTPVVTATTPVVTATTPVVTATTPVATATTPVATVSTPAVTVTATTPEAAPSVSVPQSTTPAVPPAPVTTSAPPASPVKTAAETSDEGERAHPVTSHAHSGGANPAPTTGVSAAAARAAPPASARGEPAADPVAAAPEGRATPKAFTRRSGQSASLGGLRVRSLPKLGNRRAVQLRFALDRAARITLVLFGPAPHCVVAGRFIVAGHRGANAVRFEGRVRNRLLQPGVYKIAPRRTGGKSVPGWSAVAVRVDRRGARRVARLPRLDCQAAGAGATEPVLSTPGRFGVAGVRSRTAKTRTSVPPVPEGLPAPQIANPFSTSERATPFALLGSLAPALLLSGIFLAVAAVLLLVKRFS
jgi:hypothetical protein